MPTLELLIDASGAQRGAQQAVTALDSVTTAATRTTRAVDSVSTVGGGRSAGGGIGGGASSSAFQVGGGSVQIAQGIAQTATALSQLNAQAAAFSAARTALELGNTIRDFQQFRGAVGGVSTVFGTLGAVIRANPIGAIATAIGLAATAMSFFGSRTKDATDQVKAQVSELTKLRSALPGIEARVALGADDTRTTAGATRETILALRERSRAEPNISIDEAARLFGITPERLRLGLEDTGIAPSVNQPLPLTRTPAVDGRGNPLGFDRVAGGGFQTGISTSAAAQFGERLIDDRAQQDRFRADGAAMDNMGAGLRAAEMQAEFRAREQAEEGSRQAQQEAAARIAESMERAAQFGEQIGASVGDAAAQLLFAGRSLRDVVGNLVRQFATQGLQSAGAGIFGAITRGVAGATATQNQGNVGFDPSSPTPND